MTWDDARCWGQPTPSLKEGPPCCGKPTAGPRQGLGSVWRACFHGLHVAPRGHDRCRENSGEKATALKSRMGALPAGFLPGKAMFATLSGRSSRPRGCLEIECLFERTMRPQADKRFLSPPRTECVDQEAPLSSAMMNTLREESEACRCPGLRHPISVQQNPAARSAFCDSSLSEQHRDHPVSGLGSPSRFR